MDTATAGTSASIIVGAIEPSAPPIVHFAYAVALGVVAAVAPLSALRLRRLRRDRRRPVCACCGRGRMRGGPPLLIFRDTGPRCTDCVRAGAGREPADERSQVEELISRVAA